LYFLAIYPFSLIGRLFVPPKRGPLAALYKPSAIIVIIIAVIIALLLIVILVAVVVVVVVIVGWPWRIARYQGSRGLTFEIQGSKVVVNKGLLISGKNAYRRGLIGQKAAHPLRGAGF
jgi:hypothetical protein